MKEIKFENLLIKDVEFAEGKGGLACGPIEGELFAKVSFTDGNQNTYHLMMSEFQGFCEFYLSDKDVFKKLVKSGEDLNNAVEFRDKIRIDQLGRISLEGEYDTLMDYLYSTEQEYTQEAVLVRYLVAVMRCEMKDLDHLIKLAKDKYLKDIDFPLSDVEKEYLGTE